MNGSRDFQATSTTGPAKAPQAPTPIHSSLQPRMGSPAPGRPLCLAVGKKGRWLSWREPALCPLSSTLTTQRKWTHLAAISSIPGPPCHYWKLLFPRRLAKTGAETRQMLCLLALNHHLTSESVDKQPLVHLTGGSSQLKGKLAGHSLRGLCHVLVAHSGLPLPPPPHQRGMRRLLPSCWPRTAHKGWGMGCFPCSLPLFPSIARRWAGRG